MSWKTMTMCGLVCGGLLGASSSFAQAPELINYQGRLVNGTNLVNGTVQVIFRLYESELGGSPVYEETQLVTAVDGLYATAIGTASPGPGALRAALTNTAVYVEVTVDGTTLTPRERLVSVAYALSPDGHSLDAADGSPQDVVKVNDAGFVGVNRDDPITALEVFGIHRDGSQYGGMYASTDLDGKPFYGYATDGLARAFHYYDDANDRWSLFVNGNRINVDRTTGNVGIGTTSPDTRLHVEGQVKITGGNPGSGKVLTSDSTGLASWIDVNEVGADAPFHELTQLVQQMAPEQELPFDSLQPIVCTNTSVFSLTVNGASLGTVIGFTGREYISKPFDFRVAVRSTVPSLFLDDKLYKPAVFTFQRYGRTTFFAGVVEEFSQAAYDGTNAVYVARFVPEAQCLDANTDYQIFQESTVDQIIDQVFADASLAPPFKNFSGSYSDYPMRVQYGETDLAFVSRLLEEEGIPYYFEHGPSGETMNLVDDNAAFATAPNGPWKYFGHRFASPGTPDERVLTIHRKSGPYRNSATVRDYLFESVALVDNAATTSGGKGSYEEYGVNLSDSGARAQLAGARLDRSFTEQRPIEGTSNIGDLKAGHRFNVDDSSGAGFTDTYLATEVRHIGLLVEDGSGSCFYYGNEFAAIPDSQPFRPERVTPKPTVSGFSTATVTGPAGQEIHVDEYGRVKVKFHWDYQGPTDDQASAWLRVAQVGHGMLLPRVGWEVLVGYVDGNIDRPVVLGKLWNGADAPPLSLPANKAVSLIRTESTPGGGGSNEIRFDDAAGSESLSLDAERDLFLTAGNTMGVNVSNDLGLDATDEVMIDSGGDMSLTAGQQFSLDASGNINFNSGQLVLETFTGEVGIGDASPEGELEVRSADAQTAILISNDAVDGDPAIRFRYGNLTQFSMGVDDTDDDFKISDSATLGINNRLIIDSATGEVTIPGNLSKGGGSFKIDHPLDPARKTLSHSFVESPDMMNVYNGNVVLDADGAAEVELPDWFEALNRDFRYQLTPIGGPGPGLFVASEVEGNRFRIEGGEPGLTVSWQVTGIRQDAYAEAHRIPVEEDKLVEAHGTYLHPDVHSTAE